MPSSVYDAVVTTAAACLICGCSWARFDEVKEDSPVASLEAPGGTKDGFGNRVSQWKRGAEPDAERGAERGAELRWVQGPLPLGSAKLQLLRLLQRIYSHGCPGDRGSVTGVQNRRPSRHEEAPAE